jgi:chemotaxis protein CheX
MDMEPLQALLCAATRDVFSTMLQMELVAQTAYRNHTPLVGADVTAFIGLAGELLGSLSIHATREQAQAFTARLLGAEPHEITDENAISDAMGEISNMVAGSLKQSFPGPKRFDLSVPTVAMPAKGIRVKTASSVVIPFLTPFGEFCAELILEERRAT